MSAEFEVPVADRKRGSATLRLDALTEAPCFWDAEQIALRLLKDAGAPVSGTLFLRPDPGYLWTRHRSLHEVASPGIRARRRSRCRAVFRHGGRRP